MRKKAASITALVCACAGFALSASGAALAAAAPPANCIAQGASGGQNGAFVAPIASSGAGNWAAIARDFGTTGGAGTFVPHCV
jgi:hypothetical protein